jgi:hypothetical protein
VLHVKTLLVESIASGGKSRMDKVNDIAKAAGCDVVGQVAHHENPRSQLGPNRKYDATKLVDNSFCGV